MFLSSRVTSSKRWILESFFLVLRLSWTGGWPWLPSKATEDHRVQLELPCQEQPEQIKEQHAQVKQPWQSNHQLSLQKWHSVPREKEKKLSFLCTSCNLVLKADSYFSMESLTICSSRNLLHSMLWWCWEPGPTTFVHQGKPIAAVQAVEFQDYPHSGEHVMLAKGSLAAYFSSQITPVAKHSWQQKVSFFFFSFLNKLWSCSPDRNREIFNKTTFTSVTKRWNTTPKLSKHFE